MMSETKKRKETPVGPGAERRVTPHEDDNSFPKVTHFFVADYFFFLRSRTKDIMRELKECRLGI